MKCLNCGVGEARKVEPFGYLPCAACVKSQSKYKVKETIEVTTDEIKEARVEFADDTLQRYRGSTASLEFIKKYGTKGFTEEEIREARNVEEGFYQDKEERYNE